MTLHQQIEQWLAAEAETAPPHRPFVTLSYAQSWDGSIARCQNQALQLSGPASARLTHHLRSLHDGILVGVGTVLSDDPQLNVRLCAGRSPQPIILDSHMRTPPSARLCQGGTPPWIMTTRSYPESPAQAAGAKVFTVARGEGDRVCLQQTLALLRQQGIKRLMVEGGASVITAFIQAQLVDALVLTVAPCLIGGYKALAHTREPLPRLSPLFTERLDDDLIVWGGLHYEESIA